eukprot:TRINITY_DN37183_c0_g1_i1.p1 TRINITY_DN37183_c0_g1~~TRINITY_DN37183_c0_g1_i1.p1  ORF type:complete len:585 (+),score=152.79 TRINITY_DN37183_c0_g1_i1:89-1843(+)
MSGFGGYGNLLGSQREPAQEPVTSEATTWREQPRAKHSASPRAQANFVKEPMVHASLALPEEDDQEALSKTLDAAVRRQEEWSKQIQSYDQKQAELNGMQWKLIREQTGTLARDLALVQQQLKDLKVDSRRALIEVERCFRENESQIYEERGLRQAMAEGFEQRLSKISLEHDAEAKQRAATDEKLLSRVEALEASAQARSKDQINFDLEMRQLRDVCEGSLQELEALKQTLDQEAKERRTGEEAFTKLLQDMRGTLTQESQDRSSSLDGLRQSLASSLELERTERISSFGSLRAAATSMQRELQPCKDEISLLRDRLAEAEAAQSQTKETFQGLEQELADRAARSQKLERRLIELSNVVERETAARSGLAEEVDQALKTFRSKTKQMVADQAENSRQEREDIKSQLLEQISSERSLREALQSATSLQLADQRAVLEGKIDGFEVKLRESVARHDAELAGEIKRIEEDQLKLAEEISKQIQSQKERFGVLLAEEQHARELQSQDLEENIDFLQGFFQDARELFLQRGQRQKQLSAKRSPRAGSPRLTTATTRTPSLSARTLLDPSTLGVNAGKPPPLQQPCSPK